MVQSARGIGYTPEFHSMPSGRKFLFGIGISHYPSAQLRNAVKDLKDIVQVLCDRYDFEQENVTLLLNEDATCENISNTLNSFTKKLEPNDSLLIYFSGHGHFDDENDEGYWVPVKAPLNSDDIHSLVSNEFVKSRIAKMRCRHILLVSDSCFSGSLLSRGQYNQDRISMADEYERKNSRWIITSGRRDEKVVDSTESNPQNSPFAAAMLSELRNNHTSKLIADKLASAVREITWSNASQIPQFEKIFGSGDMGGRFIFTLRGDKNEDYSIPSTSRDKELKSETDINTWLEIKEKEIEMERRQKEKEERLNRDAKELENRIQKAKEWEANREREKIKGEIIEAIDSYKSKEDIKDFEFLEKHRYNPDLGFGSIILAGVYLSKKDTSPEVKKWFENYKPNEVFAMAYFKQVKEMYMNFLHSL